MGVLSIREAKQKTDMEIWRQRVVDCRTSGMTIAKWCEENQIHLKTYYYWQRKIWDYEMGCLKSLEKSPPNVEKIRFAQVDLSVAPGTESTTVAIIRHGNWSIEISNSFDPSLLSRVMQMVAQDV